MTLKNPIFWLELEENGHPRFVLTAGHCFSCLTTVKEVKFKRRTSNFLDVLVTYYYSVGSSSISDLSRGKLMKWISSSLLRVSVLKTLFKNFWGLLGWEFIYENYKVSCLVFWRCRQFSISSFLYSVECTWVLFTSCLFTETSSSHQTCMLTPLSLEGLIISNECRGQW